MKRASLLLIVLSSVLPACKSVSLGSSQNPDGAVGEAGSLCFSPTANLGLAKSGGVGCSCDPAVERDACVQGVVALICMNGQWHAGVDGPCMPAFQRDAAVDTVSCYSPTSNLGIAYQSGAVGCSCNSAVDRDVCIQGVALMCMNGRWQAVEDGPCMPVVGRDGGGTDSTGTCPPRSFDVDCFGAAAIYACVQRGDEWVWIHACPDPRADGGSGQSADVGVGPGCDLAKAAQAISVAGLTTVGEGQTLNMDLPANLDATANWGVKASACRDGGYDLSAVAGKSVCLVKYDSTSLCQNQPASAWVVMSDGVVRCVYQSAPLTPGIYSVHDPVCSSPDAAVPSCPGTNLASRTCRNTTSDCIPSSCTCASNGTWSCTTDCRSLPLCSDGGTCPDARIDSSKAAAAFTQFMRQRNPDMNPTVTYGAEEKTVPNLWEVMRAQLFFGKAYLEDGSTSQEIAFLYRKCAVSSLLTDDLWFGLIDSGVVANGVFYYSWGWGSGIYRSNLGKLVANETSLVKSTSPSYFNPSSGPPGLVVALEGGKLVVYRATVYWGKFNEWSNPERMGLLKDFGDRLALVDDNGKELSTTLP